jgi:tetratricopeptide (TPR) repeat protein
MHRDWSAVHGDGAKTSNNGRKGLVIQNTVERRRLLHERAGQAIEALFSDRLEDHLSELAHHYDRSGNVRKAVEYLGRAGHLAAQQTAHSEAAGYFKRALELLKNLPDSADRGRQEFDLQMALSWSLFILNQVDPEREPVLIRARELSEQLGDDAQQMEAVLQLALVRFGRREYAVARELAQRVLGLAEPAKATAMVAGAHCLLGTTASWLGELDAAREHLELAVALFGPGPFRNFGEAQYALSATVTLPTTCCFSAIPRLRSAKAASFWTPCGGSLTLLPLPGPCCGRLRIMQLFGRAGPAWSKPKKSF